MDLRLYPLDKQVCVLQIASCKYLDRKWLQIFWQKFFLKNIFLFVIFTVFRNFFEPKLLQ